MHNFELVFSHSVCAFLQHLNALVRVPRGYAIHILYNGYIPNGTGLAAYEKPEILKIYKTLDISMSRRYN